LCSLFGNQIVQETQGVKTFLFSVSNVTHSYFLKNRFFTLFYVPIFHYTAAKKESPDE